ncbi:Abi family protein [Campylobacter pinnipediorum]|uniref:Abi family protein n=1 Tax=Campylobacter pinnipediorum TaxID=1965231 RepID=UPI0009954A4B
MIWVLIELLNFGELISFYKFYKENYSIEKISVFNLYAIKSLRNIATHNSCILHLINNTSNKKHENIHKIKTIFKR